MESLSLREIVLFCIILFVLSMTYMIVSYYYNMHKYGLQPEIYYTIHGSIDNNNGPILVFLHGFPDFEYLWSSQIKYFTSLNRGYCCITLEIPNFNIDRIQNPWGYDILTVVNSLGNKIKNILGGKNNKECIWIAHDWGAFLSELLYIYFKNDINIKKLVLLDVGDGYDNDPKELHKYSYQLICGLSFLFPIKISTYFLRKYLQTKLRLGDTKNTVKFPIFNLEKKYNRKYFHSTSTYLYYNAIIKPIIFGINNDDTKITKQRLINEFDGLPILFIAAIKGDDPTRFYSKHFKQFINDRNYCKWIEFNCFHWIMDEQLGLAKKFNHTLYQFIQ